MKKIWLLPLVFGLGLTVCSGAWASAPGGFFSVTQTASGVWQLLNPQGQAFFSQGVCVVVPKDGAIKAGADGYDPLKKEGLSQAAWEKQTVNFLKEAGFNSLGSWSDESLYPYLPYTCSLSLAGYADMGKRLVDVFSPDYALRLQRAAQQGAASKVNDKNLIGYFLDNELPWYGDTGWPGPQNTPLLDKYLALPEGEPGLQRAQAFLGRRLAPGEAPTAAERSGFLALVADQYFKTATEAVRAVDPSHLILGCRFAGATPREVIAACGRYCDVVSVNAYSKSGIFDFDLFDTVYALTKRPVLLTEFSYRAMENRSGDKNGHGADVTVATQAERAAKLKQYLGSALQLKYLLGYHWFQYFDESPQGRSFDDEDSDYGLVDINNKPYAPLLAAFKTLNASAESLHVAASRPLPDKVPEALAVKVRQAVGAEKTLAAPRVWGDANKPYGTPLVWAEASAKGTLSNDQGAMVLTYDSGKFWGLGVGLAPLGERLSDGSVDILGASTIEVDLNVTLGQKFNLFLNESGIADPSSESFNGVGGADGEGWTSPDYVGTGQRQVLHFKLTDAALRGSWGNPHGNHTLDLQAIKSLDLAIVGNQGSGTLKLYSVRCLP